MRLAGTYHPIEYLLLRLDTFFPTLEKSGALYSSKQQLKFLLNGDVQEIEVFDQVTIQKIRSKRSYSYEWTHSPNLLDEPKYSKQSTLYDEEKNGTLLLYFPSDKRDLCDVLILTFPKNAVMKGTDNVFSGLSTSDKLLISTFSMNVLKSEFERIQEEKYLIEGFARIQKSQNNKIEHLLNTLEETRLQYLSSLRVLVYDNLELLNEEFKCTFIPSNELIDQLAQSQLGVDEINKALRFAAELGYHLHFGEDKITLDSTYIKVNETKRTKKDTAFTVTDKTFQLLERYEESAEKVQKSDLPINGKNVANYLEPAVTPPAITDAVKKNEKRIRFLLEQYSEKWPLIRKYLKPIERLDLNNHSSVKRVS